MRVCGPLLLTLYVVRRCQRCRSGENQTASTAAPCGPFRRGQPYGPWTAGTACGCTLAAHRLGRVAHRRPTTGGTPPEPPAVHTHGPPFEFLQKPENRQGLGVGHGQPCGLPTPATVAPVPGTPSGWVTEAAGARCAKAHQGAQPWGSWGCKPPAKERPRRGPEAGGAVFIRPPWGGLILVSPAQRANNIASAMCSESTFAKMGPPGAH